MRVLNSRTLKFDSGIFKYGEHEYAIVSHRWRDEEVDYQEMLESIRSPKTEQKNGYEKIKRACKQAVKDKLEYLWIDTCCIDKSSSAELSESINSMYAWYRAASVCYAYLDDVPDYVYAYADPDFDKSAWFTRGWTLQELLAPEKLKFFSKGWREIGRKSSLYNQLSKITGIDIDVLTGSTSVLSVSIAQRMSWASKRKTTRVEDQAYCLMGMFNVNMPMLYGEGEKAFIRLQEEIMADSDDESIFAWRDPNADPEDLYGLLAKTGS
ncbi:uncharacterized protein K452DRAFT_353673 [Aplosporella prunicola CBS 121167]|uniref:Uncharacterized protein n=1 Tax=Aplosporella prunicola CBS 121167 TaxID=1176127 RepID=A0A6A6B2X8_9PEZI|nr:uncharacterized protein K452DRAFT_353673 [Aplosporella prunicola CBS 121167]KAF2137081.1 hypothetical protein K452DRAFT_353673 [Aplosporella prunicola CBS 121167]